MTRSANAGHVRLVRHQHDRHAALAVEAPDGGHDLVRGLRVEIAGRLVGEQDGRVVDERACDGDALLLAAGELAREVVLAALQPEEVERLERPVGAVRRPARVEERQGDVLEGARPREQVEALEDEPDAAAPDAREGRLVLRRDVHRLEQVLPAGRPVEAAEDVHERRLARARRAHDGDELSLLHREADPAQRVHLDVAQVVDLGEVADVDDGLGHRATLLRSRGSAAARRRRPAGSDSSPPTARA